jgi:hypothetical protein
VSSTTSNLVVTMQQNIATMKKTLPQCISTLSGHSFLAFLQAPRVPINPVLHQLSDPTMHMQDLTGGDLEDMWTKGRGGEPGRNEIGVQFKPYPECLPGYFGGFATIVHDSSHEVQVRLGKGQHHLKMPRSYLRLYPSKQVREEWLELTNQVETWTAIGTRPLLLFKHCHNAFCLFFHCHNA